MRKLAGLILLAGISLTGCVPFAGSWNEPSASVPHATIRGVDQMNILAGGKYVTVIGIDNHPVDVRLKWSNESEIRLQPGTHKVTISILENHGLLSEGEHGSADVSFNARVGERYKAEGSVAGKTATVWIVNSEGRVVSNKGSIESLPANTNFNSIPDLDR